MVGYPAISRVSLYSAAIVFLFNWVVLAGRRLYQLRTAGAGTEP